jgi:GNAT superfamily N-acetyltransferase
VETERANRPSHPTTRGDHPAARDATSDDVDTIARSLASAFADDPVMRWVLGDVEDPEGRLVHVFASMARGNIRDGHHAVLAGDGGSVAMWRDVDRWKSPVRHWLRSMPGIIRSFRGGTVRLLRGFAMVERHHPTEPHLYLAVLGTRAEHQGRGLGADALAPMLERCDREGVPAYTESSNPKNLPFYFRQGFVQRGDELRLTAASPPVIPLWREPR